MSTNNEVKAPRPCTLWGWTFDSNQVISVILNHAKTKVWVYGENYKDLAFYFDTDAEGKQFEALQAIASAQRQWLKLEGFQFKDDCFYRIKVGDSPHVLTGLYDKPNNLFYVSELYEGGKGFSVPTIWVTAFKPADDSQEAWNAVAKIQVASYKR
jgi:hypothetical protein